jgi:hypothetical protein
MKLPESPEFVAAYRMNGALATLDAPDVKLAFLPIHG